MRLNLWLQVPQNVALENLQVTTLLFASACPLVAVDLMRFLGIRERGVHAGALVMAFQPSLWILGATLNNDILSILCILACILFTVRWERTRRMRDILGIALSLGAGMATKLSAALLIPCVALAFIVAFSGISSGGSVTWDSSRRSWRSACRRLWPGRCTICWRLICRSTMFACPPRRSTWDTFPCGSGLAFRTGSPGGRCFIPACAKPITTCGCRRSKRPCSTN